jgi:hypothetical protein
MIRKGLLLLALAGIYVAITRRRVTAARLDHAAEAQWANEGGASAPATV